MKRHQALTALLATAISISSCAGEVSDSDAIRAIAEQPTRYERLSASGSTIRNSEAAPGACVKDQQTGLVWELKTDDDGVHDKDHAYRWGGVGAEKIGSKFFDDWNVLVSATNKEALCGFEDWRIPTVEELQTLVISPGAEPVFDKAFFPHMQAAPYWSASGYAGHPEHGQSVNFADGTSHYFNGYRGNRLFVRLVRGTVSEEVKDSP